MVAPGMFGGWGWGGTAQLSVPAELPERLRGFQEMGLYSFAAQSSLQNTPPDVLTAACLCSCLAVSAFSESF